VARSVRHIVTRGAAPVRLRFVNAMMAAAASAPHASKRHRLNAARRVHEEEKEVRYEKKERVREAAASAVTAQHVPRLRCRG